MPQLGASASKRPQRRRRNTFRFAPWRRLSALTGVFKRHRQSPLHVGYAIGDEFYGSQDSPPVAV